MNRSRSISKNQTRRRWPKWLSKARMNRLLSEVLPEEKLVQKFTALELGTRTPREFLRLTIKTFPTLRTCETVPSGSWSEVEAFLKGPQFYGVDIRGKVLKDTLCWQEDAKAALFALYRLHEPSRSRSSSDNQGLWLDPRVGFCAYCWRLGREAHTSRGFGRLGAFRDRRPSSVRCYLHKPDIKALKSHVDMHRRLVRQARGLYDEIIEREAYLIKNDKFLDPGSRFWMTGDTIIISNEFRKWGDYIERSFPFACEALSGLSASPDKALAVLDDEKNAFSDRAQVHKFITDDRRRLAFYLLPMLLRADVWHEIKRRKQAARLETNRSRRYPKATPLKVRLPRRKRFMYRSP